MLSKYYLWLAFPFRCQMSDISILLNLLKSHKLFRLTKDLFLDFKKDCRVKALIKFAIYSKNYLKNNISNQKSQSFLINADKRYLSGH